MTPAARLQAAIDILEEIEKSTLPADRILDAWGKAHRFAGSKDRAAIAERVFEILRRRSECAWAMQNSSPRDWVLGALKVIDRLPDTDIARLFAGEGHGPSPLSADEARRLRAPVPPQSPEIALSFPAWLAPELERAFKGHLAREMAPFLRRAPVDLRVNTLRASREALAAALGDEGIETAPHALSPWGLRITGGPARAVTRTDPFDEGWFEVQDMGSQRAALLLGAGRDETVLDLCAGGGGKALALAAMMENKGALIACDIGPARLAELSLRARRAGASIIKTKVLDPDWMGGAAAPDIARGSIDRILIDAPCSGTGTWRRNPETKWRLTQARLVELTRLQGTLIDAALPWLKPGGTLAYVTCSLLCGENEDVVSGALARHAGLRLAAQHRLSPASGDCDGFGIAILERN